MPLNEEEARTAFAGLNGRGDRPFIPRPARDRIDFEPRALVDLAVDALPRRLQHISASSLKTFARCPEQYRRRYMLKHKEPPSTGILWGRADHTAHEFNFRQKLVSARDVPTSDVQLLFAAGLDTLVDEAGGVGEVDWNGRDLKDKPPAMAHAWVKDRGVKLAAAYHEQVSPGLQPLALEEEFEIDVEGIPVPILGYVDLRVDDHESVKVLAGRNERMIERKTRSASQQKPSGDDVLQGSIYQLANPLPVDYHLSVKTAAPKIVGAAGEFTQPVGPRTRTIERMRRVIVGISMCMATFGPDEPWPDAMTHPWACGFCGFQKDCPWWQGHDRWPERLF